MVKPAQRESVEVVVLSLPQIVNIDGFVSPLIATVVSEPGQPPAVMQLLDPHIPAVGEKVSAYRSLWPVPFFYGTKTQL